MIIPGGIGSGRYMALAGLIKLFQDQCISKIGVKPCIAMEKKCWRTSNV